MSDKYRVFHNHTLEIHRLQAKIDLLAFDGERKRRLHVGETATLRVVRDGPRVVDVRAVMTAAARAGVRKASSIAASSRG